jgi:hypothetical protein
MHMAYVVGAGIALVSFVAGAVIRSWLAFALPLALAIAWAFLIADSRTETDPCSSLLQSQRHLPCAASWHVVGSTHGGVRRRRGSMLSAASATDE